MKKSAFENAEYRVPNAECLGHTIRHSTPSQAEGGQIGIRHLLTLLLLALLPTVAANAQIDTEASRQALQQIRGFYLHVDVEGSLGLTQDDALNVRTIRSRVKQRLEDAGLNVLENLEGIDQANEPYLYVHVNMLEVERGLVPFAVNTQFYQRVELPRRPRQSLVAATWDTGLVGLVSYDNLDLIADSAVGSVTNFISDYQQVNP